MSASKEQPKLTIELVPKSQWFTNLRSELTKGQWDRLRKACYKRAGYRCEVCGGVGPKHPVECHEIWDFDDERQIQRLDGLIALCPSCHQVKHIGFAFKRGKGDQVLAHLAKVNGWSLDQAAEYAAYAFLQWKVRSSLKYTLDLDWLEGAEQYIADAREVIKVRAREAIVSASERVPDVNAVAHSATTDRRSEALTARSQAPGFGAWS